MADTGFGAIDAHQVMEMTNEIVGIESVTVPYGSFDNAIKVVSTGTLEMTTSMGDTEMPAMSIDTSNVTWYVENVGRVRSEDLSDSFGTGDASSTVTELISIE
ncbi:MAG: hypothetical protein R3C44_14710 [Chloroflexota bacterium]